MYNYPDTKVSAGSSKPVISLAFFLTVASHDLLSLWLSKTEPRSREQKEWGKAEGQEEQQQMDMAPKGLNAFKGNRWLRLVRAKKTKPRRQHCLIWNIQSLSQWNGVSPGDCS